VRWWSLYLLVYLIGLVPVSAQQEAGDKRFAAAPCTLAQALGAVAERYDIQYIAVGCSDRWEEPFVKAACLEEVVDELLSTYGASGVGFDGLWFIDARPRAEDRWQALRDLLPPEVAGAANPEVSEQEQWTAARSRLRQMLRDRLGGPPPTRPGHLLVLPFSVPKAEAPELQTYRLREVLSASQWLLTASPPVLTGGLKLDEKRNLWLASEVGAFEIGHVPVDWDVEWGQPSRTAARPHFSLHLAPLAVQRDLAGPLGSSVDLGLNGTVADLAGAIAQRTHVRVSGPMELMELSVAARGSAVPLWLVLTGLSVASGLDVDLSSARPEYKFAVPEGLPALVFAGSTPAQRLQQLHFRQASHCRPFAMWAWLMLTDDQRAKLEAGEVLDVIKLTPFQQWTARQVWLGLREPLLASTVRRVDPIIQAPLIRGVLLVDEGGEAWGGVRVQDGETRWYRLSEGDQTPPGAVGVAEAGAGGGKEIAAEIMAVSGLTFADRLSAQVPWWRYGDRKEVGTGFWGGPKWGLVAAPPGTAASETLPHNDKR